MDRDWQVDLFLATPARLRGGTQQHHPLKGVVNGAPFYSDVQIHEVQAGFEYSMTAHASTEELAFRFALVFTGELLDVLALRTNTPFYVSFAPTDGVVSRHRFSHSGRARPIVDSEELDYCFRRMFTLSTFRPSFLRSLGWYRKALVTEDPFDRYLAAWNSIEILAGAYKRNSEHTAQGAKNQVWDIFCQLWGETPDGAFDFARLPGELQPIIRPDWVDRYYDQRIGIAHGAIPVSVHSVSQILQMLPDLERVAHQTLLRFDGRTPDDPSQLARTNVA